MKNLLTFTAIAALGLATFSSCKKSSSDSSTSYTLTATIGGKSFNGTNCLAGLSGTALSISGGPFSGTTATFPYVSIFLTKYTGTGTYNVDMMTNIITIDSSSTSGIVAAYGTVTITNTSPITGTFSCTTTDSVKVTGGTFTAKKP